MSDATTVEWPQISDVDSQLLIVASRRSPGNAHTQYQISLAPEEEEGTPTPISTLHFHTGDPQKGVTGITNEALLAIVAHRLQGFQEGPFPNQLNQEALENIQDALKALANRTRDRKARKVDGKQVP
jgi:hypothetical protein